MILITDIMILCFIITLWTCQWCISCIGPLCNEPKARLNCLNP